ncbi:MAG: 5'/3'-nucleotidase SurE [Candidatus Brocadiaceae bacterium]|jgi:5'-nucleotidase
MRIVLTNDDGPFAPGVGVLRTALAELGEVTVVCPAGEQSGVSHSITYIIPVRAHEVRLTDGGEATIVTGTPADCVKFALLQLLDGSPDLIVSGPNMGINAGIDVFYSGTVAAAIEGGLHGIRSAAFSCSRRNAGQMQAVAEQVVRVLSRLLQSWPEPEVVFNVNVPHLGDGEPGLAFTEQSTSFPRGSYSAMQDAHGRTHYWLDSTAGDDPAAPGSDVAAVEAGDISVTPFRLNLTHAEVLRELRANESRRASEEGPVEKK